MDKNTIINFVCEHATVAETITKSVYSVRFPSSTGKFFTADDTEVLVNKVYAFTETNEGQKLIAGYDFSAYTDENYNTEEE